MSEIATEEAFENEVTSEEQAQEIVRQRRPHSALVEAAGEAFDTITAPEGESVPPPNQEPVTAARRQAAVQEARQATEPAEAPAEDLAAVPEPEVELPPPAPQEWLDEEPDYEAEARAELEVETPDEEYEYDDDPRIQEERIKRVALEKKLAHVEAEKAKVARKNWTEEGLEHAPLAKFLLGEKLEKATATSKRGFLREVAQAHEQMRSALEASLGPAKQIAAEEITEAKAEAKAAAERAYGKPTTGPGQAPVQAAEASAKVAAAREQKGLRGAVRALMDLGEVNP